MTKEEKIEFLQWVVKSGKYKVWHFEKDTIMVDGRIYLQPKEVTGKCVVVWWKIDSNEAGVQLFESLREHDYDFGTMHEGVGYIDCFYVPYSLVLTEIGLLLTMFEEQSRKNLEKRQEEMWKVGDADNFFNCMKS